jgi:hypothetical protein
MTLILAEPASPFNVVSSITDQWKLAAFALAVVLYLVLKFRQQPIPKAAWAVILSLVIVPIGASVYQSLALAKIDHSAIYRVRVTVIDPQRVPVDGALVKSSVGGEAKSVASGTQFDIPAASLPKDGKVTIFATLEQDSLKGEQNLELRGDYNPSITIQLAGPAVEIRGQVVDARGNAITGARVWVVGYGSEGITTPSDGNFQLASHKAIKQQVELHAEKPGYRPVNQFHPAGVDPVTLMLQK